MVAPLQVTGCWVTVTALLVHPVVDPDCGSSLLQAATNDGSERTIRRRADVLIGVLCFLIWCLVIAATGRTASRACECSRSSPAFAVSAARFHRRRPRR